MGAKQQKPQIPKRLVRTRGTNNLPKVEERYKASDGTAETGIYNEYKKLCYWSKLGQEYSIKLFCKKVLNIHLVKLIIIKFLQKVKISICD